MQTKADYLVLLAHSIVLEVNITKIMAMRGNHNNANHIHYRGRIPGWVCESFCYLGCMITTDGGAEEDVNCRLNKARAAFGNATRCGRPRKSPSARSCEYLVHVWSQYCCTEVKHGYSPIASHRIIWPNIISKAALLNLICCLDRAPFGKLLHFVQNVHSIFIQNLNLKIASSWINGGWM